MQDYKYIYFLGIGGIGMSALAEYFNKEKKIVSGYDRTPSPITDNLISMGIDVHFEENAGKIPADKEKTLVVLTPAIPKDNKELIFVTENGYKILKRSEVLGEIASCQKCIAVAGTHGKTTTSTMIAHILTDAGKGCNAFLGGISKNYDTNLLVCDTGTIVAEADEYDRSFLKLFPEIAVITSMDPDHLDIYGTEAAYKKAFEDFASQVKNVLILKKGIEIPGTEAKIFHYDKDRADFHAENISITETGHPVYDLVHPKGVIKSIKLGTPGMVNIENSIGAAAACLIHGIEEEKIKKALENFRGVKRRIEFHVNTPKITYIDDYAHHPKEIENAIISIKDIFPGRKITVIFQPHLYSRTKDFAEGFCKSLSLADKVILLDIYPARELPLEGVSSEMLLENISCKEKIKVMKEDLIPYLEKSDLDVLITMGAGDIDRLVKPITELLNKRI